MKKKIIVFFTLLVLMLTAYLAVGCSTKKDFSSYNKEYEQTVKEINISLDVSEIEVKRSDTEKITLHYYDTEESFYSVSEENGVLTVSRTNLGELKENIRFGLGMKKYYKLTLAIPEKHDGTLLLSTTSGDIFFKGVSSENDIVNVKTESGDVKVEESTLKEFNVDGKSSEILLKELDASSINAVTVAGEVISKNIDCAKLTVKGEAAEVDIEDVSIGQVSVSLTSGHVDLDNVKIGSTINVSVTSGNVEGNGIDAGICTVTSKEGDIYLKNLWIGSALYLVSDSGDVDALVSDPVTDFTLDAVSDYGKNNIAGTTGFGGFKKITVRNVTGDISVKFAG